MNSNINKPAIVVMALLLIIVIAEAIVLVKYIKPFIDKVERPVEEWREKVDSLKTINDNITNEINKLDSIKNDEVNKIHNLNRDSTIKLFKELVSK